MCKRFVIPIMRLLLGHVNHLRNFHVFVSFIVVGVILREDINWWHFRCHLFKNKRVKYLRAMRCICFMQVYIYLRGYEGYLQSWCGCRPQLGTDDAQLRANLHPHGFQTRFGICNFWLV